MLSDKNVELEFADETVYLVINFASRKFRNIHVILIKSSRIYICVTIIDVMCILYWNILFGLVLDNKMVTRDPRTRTNSHRPVGAPSGTWIPDGDSVTVTDMGDKKVALTYIPVKITLSLTKLLQQPITSPTN